MAGVRELGKIKIQRGYCTGRRLHAWPGALDHDLAKASVAKKTTLDRYFAGLSWATVRRAKAAESVAAVKGGMAGGWSWVLPKVLTETQDAHTMSKGTFEDA
jgi:hypothetical protein